MLRLSRAKRRKLYNKRKDCIIKAEKYVRNDINSDHRKNRDPIDRFTKEHDGINYTIPDFRKYLYQYTGEYRIVTPCKKNRGKFTLERQNERRLRTKEELLYPFQGNAALHEWGDPTPKVCYP
jgi:hypothetical protein